MTRSADTRLGALLAVLLLALNVGSVSSRLGFLHKAKQVKEYDHWRYIEMSRGPEGRPALQREPPYCFRLAVPALVRGLGRLGLAENPAFFLVTNLSLFGFLLVLWLHLRDLGFSLALRVAGLLVVGFTQGAVRWFEYQYWMTDPAALFLVMLAFFLLERGRWGALLVTSVVAAFVRETYVLVYPYVFLRELRTGRPLLPAAGRTAALAALPFAILVAIRRAGGAQPARRLRLRDRRQHDLPPQPPARQPALRRDASGPSACWCRSSCCSRAAFPASRAGISTAPSYVLSVYATLVISNNNERPLAYALPALVPAALWCARAFLAGDEAPGSARPRRGRVPPGALLGGPAVGGDRHEHLPARPLDDRRRDGRLLDGGAGRPGPSPQLTAVT